MGAANASSSNEVCVIFLRVPVGKNAFGAGFDEFVIKTRNQSLIDQDWKRGRGMVPLKSWGQKT